MYSLEEHVFFVKSYYSMQKNLKEVLRLYGKQFGVGCTIEVQRRVQSESSFSRGSRENHVVQEAIIVELGLNDT